MKTAGNIFQAVFLVFIFFLISGVNSNFEPPIFAIDFPQFAKNKSALIFAGKNREK